MKTSAQMQIVFGFELAFQFRIKRFSELRNANDSLTQVADFEVN